MSKKKKKAWNMATKILWWMFWIGLAVLLTLFMVLATRYVYHFCHDFFSEKVEVERVYQVEFVIPAGESPSQTARRLQNKGLIRNRFLFLAQMKFYDRTLYAGQYTLTNDMTTREVLMTLSSDNSDG